MRVAGCLGMLALSSPVVSFAITAKIEASGAVDDGGIERLTFYLFVATLIGIPCLLIAYKGFRVDSHSMIVRRRCLLLSILGVGTLVLGGLVSVAIFLLADVIGIGGGIITTGLIIVGFGMIYVGLLTAIMGVDIRKEMGR